MDVRTSELPSERFAITATEPDVAELPDVSESAVAAVTLIVAESPTLDNSPVTLVAVELPLSTKLNDSTFSLRTIVACTPLGVCSS